MAGDIDIPDAGGAVSAGKSLEAFAMDFGVVVEAPEVTFVDDTKVDIAIADTFPQDVVDEINEVLSTKLGPGIASLGESVISAVGVMVTTDKLNGERVVRCEDPR
ncbi:hypothetical protein SAMN05216266_11098 [Amycolatopsis marina]|uniref:Uncharacterized protein n=1 Tax=Amycolatopsis marina TaxID=490629 RepID=A0A1I1ARL2_9PSEU|nr:hypothetical protein [Amycolatopsis marina]SFB40654.1 hypothetical protein SAMN05216266_11098 [Amycolatopsis marina]